MEPHPPADPKDPSAVTRARLTLGARRTPCARFTGTVSVQETITVSAPVTIVRRRTTYRGRWHKDAPPPAVDARWERRGPARGSRWACILTRLARPFLTWFDPRFW